MNQEQEEEYRKRIAECKGRIADLKFALGDDVGWFDRAMDAERARDSLKKDLQSAGTEIAQYRERLQIDPGGSDKIDELEQALQFAKHAEEQAKDSERRAVNALETMREARQKEVKELADLKADRDEWRTQHENALACWKAEVVHLRAKEDRQTKDFKSRCDDYHSALGKAALKNDALWIENRDLKKKLLVEIQAAKNCLPRIGGAMWDAEIKQTAVCYPEVDEALRGVGEALEEALWILEGEPKASGTDDPDYGF